MAHGGAAPEPVGAAEFQALMARLGPWPRGRRVAVAVSGGADSLSLAWLAKSWGEPVGLIVDHGLRPESGEEARQARRRLEALGIEARILAIRDLQPGAGVAARARAARYAALEQGCAELGLPDLLLGHHARDQAETVLMRREAGSGPDGLAGMAAISYRGSLRLVRPLLSILPGRLRATLLAAGVVWSEDPSNQDGSALRTRLRARLAEGSDIYALNQTARANGELRAGAGSGVAERLVRSAALFPEGYALLAGRSINPRCLAALIRAVGGRVHAPAFLAVEALAAKLRPATLAGVRVMLAGRAGAGFLLVREAVGVGPPVAAMQGAVWDNRFRLAEIEGVPLGAEVRALGRNAPRDRRQLPAAVVETLPAIWLDGEIIAVPHLREFTGWTNLRVRLTLHPPEPACGAPWIGDAQLAQPHHVC